MFNEWKNWAARLMAKAEMAWHDRLDDWASYDKHKASPQHRMSMVARRIRIAERCGQEEMVKLATALWWTIHFEKVAEEIYLTNKNRDLLLAARANVAKAQTMLLTCRI